MIWELLTVIYPRNTISKQNRKSGLALQGPPNGPTNGTEGTNEREHS